MIDYKIIPNGSVRRVADGATIPPDERNGDYQRFLAWLAEGNVAPAEEPPPPARIITPRQFRERFTASEQAAIMQGAIADVAVLGWRLRAAEASEIDLDHPETISGMDFLVSKGLLTEARKAEILA